MRNCNWMMIGLMMVLTGCGGQSGAEDSTADAQPRSNVIGEPLQRSLDKAEAVEELSRQRKSELDDALAGAE